MGMDHVCALPEFSVGDQPPSTYLAWHEWARVQVAGGLRQQRCDVCGLWRFPQEKCCPEPTAKAMRYSRSSGGSA